MSARVLIGLAILSVPVSAGMAQAPEGRLGPGKREPFKHSTHVPGAWADWMAAKLQFEFDESDLDCLGCHPVKNPTGVSDGVCADCHFGSFLAEGRRSPRAEEMALFRHVDHATNLVCRSCHGPREAQAAPAAPRPVPADMLVRPGTKYCLACHGPQAGDFYAPWIAPAKNEKVLKAAADKLVGVLGRLNTAKELDRRDFPARAFFHRDHLGGWPDTIGTEECAACHPAVADSVSACEAGRGDPAGGLGRNIFGVEACGKCHLTLERGSGATRALGFKAGERPWSTLTAGTFSHRDHLRNPAPRDAPDLNAGRQALKQTGCLTCHLADPAPGVDTFGLKPELASRSEERSSYDGCVGAACHPSWKVVPRTEGVLQEPDHAALAADSSRCGKCHRLDYATDMKDIAFTVRVERLREPEFTIARHVHDFVAGKDRNAGKNARTAQDCSRCHKGDLPEQPSRIQKREFSHATHLPRTAEPRDCERCHGAIRETAGPADIGTERFPLHDAKVCGDCHRGEALAVEPKAAPAAVEAPARFGHAAHVGKRLPDGRILTCIDCHEGSIEAGRRGVGVLPKAKDCSRCHGHQEFPAATGRVSDAYVKTCLNCHRLGVPPSGGELQGLTRAVIAGTLDPQHHPDPAQRPCKACHQVAVERPGAVTLESDDLVYGTGWYKGFDRLGRAFHKENDGRVDRFSIDQCVCCHWANQGQGRERYKWPQQVPQAAKLDVMRARVKELLKPKLDQDRFPGVK